MRADRRTMMRPVSPGAPRAVRSTLALTRQGHFLGVPLAAVLAIALLVVALTAAGCSRTRDSTTTAASAAGDGAVVGAGLVSDQKTSAGDSANGAPDHTATTAAEDPTTGTTSGSAAGSPTITSDPGTATTSANTTTTSADGRPTGSQSGGSGLTPAEAAALDSQLAAIERELDSIGLPSDDDFSGLEAELP